MNKKLKKILGNFSDRDLEKWSDSRSISRGRVNATPTDKANSMQLDRSTK